MILIGILGRIGSGKDLFSEYLPEIAGDKKILVMRFSDLLKETLDLWNLPQTRHNLQYLAITMSRQFGEGVLTHAVKRRIESKEADIVILGGVRWESDVEFVRSFKKNYLVYIVADQKIRYERIKKRSEKIGEKNISFERFLAEDDEPTETHISDFGMSADVIIENNSSLKEYKAKIQDFYNTYLAKSSS